MRIAIFCSKKNRAGERFASFDPVARVQSPILGVPYILYLSNMVLMRFLQYFIMLLKIIHMLITCMLHMD